MVYYSKYSIMSCKANGLAMSAGPVLYHLRDYLSEICALEAQIAMALYAQGHAQGDAENAQSFYSRVGDKALEQALGAVRTEYALQGRRVVTVEEKLLPRTKSRLSISERSLRLTIQKEIDAFPELVDQLNEMADALNNTTELADFKKALNKGYKLLAQHGAAHIPFSEEVAPQENKPRSPLVRRDRALVVIRDRLAAH